MVLVLVLVLVLGSGLALTLTLTLTLTKAYSSMDVRIAQKCALADQCVKVSPEGKRAAIDETGEPVRVDSFHTCRLGLVIGLGLGLGLALALTLTLPSP